MHVLILTNEAFAALLALNADARAITAQVMLDLLLRHFARASGRSTSHPLGRQLIALERALVDAIANAFEVQMMNELAVRVDFALWLRRLGRCLFS